MAEPVRIPGARDLIVSCLRGDSVVIDTPDEPRCQYCKQRLVASVDVRRRACLLCAVIAEEERGRR